MSREIELIWCRQSEVIVQIPKGAAGGLIFKDCVQKGQAFHIRVFGTSLVCGQLVTREIRLFVEHFVSVWTRCSQLSGAAWRRRRSSAQLRRLSLPLPPRAMLRTRAFLWDAFSQAQRDFLGSRQLITAKAATTFAAPRTLRRPRRSEDSACHSGKVLEQLSFRLALDSSRATVLELAPTVLGRCRRWEDNI